MKRMITFVLGAALMLFAACVSAPIQAATADAETLLNRGVEYAKNEDYDRAIADFTAAIRLKPDYYEALNNRGVAYDDKGDLDLAIADWEAVLRIAPNDANARRNIETARQTRGY